MSLIPHYDRLDHLAYVVPDLPTAIQAIERQDLILLQAIVFLTAIMVVVLNLILDIVYKWLDPRIELGAQ
ncbi:MAG: ABC transporter permease subunit [Pseudomonadota bacterium]